MSKSSRSANINVIQIANEGAYKFFFNKPDIQYFKLSIDEILAAKFETKQIFITAIKNYLKQLPTPTFFDLNKANKKGNIIDIELVYNDNDPEMKNPLIKTIYESKKLGQENIHSNSVYKLDDFLKFICFKSVKEVRQITTKKGRTKKVDFYSIEIALLMNPTPNINTTSEYFKTAKLYQNTSKINKFSFQFFIEKITPIPRVISSVSRRTPFYLSTMDVQVNTIRASDKKIKLITDIETIFRATDDVVSMEEKIKLIDEQIDKIKTIPLNLVKSPIYTDKELEYIKTEVIKKINIRDTQLMPPPSKKPKKSGGTKKIIRKVLTDKKGKSYIKFNDLIIYLK